jgi:hypothetical protein
MAEVEPALFGLSWAVIRVEEDFVVVTSTRIPENDTTLPEPFVRF